MAVLSRSCRSGFLFLEFWIVLIELFEDLLEQISITGSHLSQRQETYASVIVRRGGHCTSCPRIELLKLIGDEERGLAQHVLVGIKLQLSRQPCRSTHGWLSLRAASGFSSRTWSASDRHLSGSHNQLLPLQSSILHSLALTVPSSPPIWNHLLQAQAINDGNPSSEQAGMHKLSLLETTAHG